MTYIRKIGNDTPKTTFTAFETWSHLQIQLPVVQWHQSVLFKGSIPNMDRLRGWGLIVPSDCLLCASYQENRQHIFFVAHIPLIFDISSRPKSISAVIQAGKVHRHFQIVLQGARNILNSAVFVMNTTELIYCSLACMHALKKKKRK
uniref:Reverse transcriptase zinc-binding domain-containing protein n=1 Tax=Brassica campestris TaxID=3711 RepID=M4EL01_BRACM